jgi:hypothetical protein
MAHKALRNSKRYVGKDGTLAILWASAHDRITYNEMADEEAKRTAEGDSSPLEKLPPALREAHPLPHSYSATRQTFRDSLKAK